MNIDDFEALEDKINGLPIPATPGNVSLARNFVMKKWKERCAELGKPEPKDLTDSCKFTSQFARIIFGGELQGNEKHQFVRLEDGRILDLNRFADDVQHQIKFPHLHDPEFFGNPEHEESMASCRGRVMDWISEFVQILKKRGKLVEFIDGDTPWNYANLIRNEIGTADLGEATHWAAEKLADLLEADGFSGALVRGRLGDHIHSWVEVGGLIADPTVERFAPKHQYVSNPGDLPYKGEHREEFGKQMDEEKKAGWFVGVKFSPETVKNLVEWTKNNQIADAPSPDRYHTTIIFSRTRKFPYTPQRWDPPLTVDPSTFELALFGPDRNILVLKFDCPELDARHWKARTEYDLPWDYPEYASHVTLTELDKPFPGDISELPVPNFPLEIVSEYVKDFE